LNPVTRTKHKHNDLSKMMSFYIGLI